MSRAPVLNTKVIDSLKKLIDEMTPADYVDTKKEVGVLYITKLIKHYESPGSVARRNKVADAAAAWRDKK